jgi:hypothetical protein
MFGIEVIYSIIRLRYRSNNKIGKLLLILTILFHQREVNSLENRKRLLAGRVGFHSSTQPTDLSD